MKKKQKTFDLVQYFPAPEKAKQVVVITVKYTYHGVVIGHGVQDGIVKNVLVDSQTMWRGTNWESVHDVFEVE